MGYSEFTETWMACAAVLMVFAISYLVTVWLFCLLADRHPLKKKGKG